MSAPSTAGPLTHRQATLWAAAVALIAHLGCLRAGLVYDDLVLMDQVPFLADWGSLGRMWSPEWYWNSGELSWRPLTVVVQIFERNTLHHWLPGLHAVSWLAHAGAAAMCVRWLGALGLPPLPSLAGACVLAAHPVGVEPVILVTFVEDPLTALLLLWGGAIAARGPGGPKQAIGLAALALAAMGVKETGLLALPLWGLSAIGGSLARGERPAWRPWLPAIGGVAGATLLFAILRFGVYVNVGAEIPRIPGGIGGLLSADLWILGAYGLVLLLPWRLCVDWTLPMSPWSGGAIAVAVLGALTIAGAGYAVWFFRRRAPGVAIGLAFAAIALAPVMNLVPISIPAAERFLYLPLAGLGLVVATAMAASTGSTAAPSPALRRWIAVGGVLLCCWVVRGWVRSGDFVDRERLWEATRAANPDSPRARLMLAGVLKERKGELRKAVELYRGVLKRWPQERNVRLHLTQTLMTLAAQTRDPRTEARELLDEAGRLLADQCERWPRDHTAWLARAQLSHMLGQPQAEMQMLEQAIQAAPEAVMSYVQLANRLGQQGKIPQALAALDRAPVPARANPLWVVERVKLLASAGRVAEAVSALRTALDRWPDNRMLQELASHPGFRDRLGARR